MTRNARRRTGYRQAAVTSRPFGVSGHRASPGTGFYSHRAPLRAQGPVEVAGVPRRAHRDLLHVHSGLRRVDDVAAADVDGHVSLAVIDQQVTWLEGGQGDVRQRGPLRV